VRNLPRLRETTYARWRSLLSALLTREDVLAATFLEQVESVPGYTANQVSPEELTTTAINSYRHLLLQLLGVPLPDDLQGLAEDLGRRRARQGVPLEDLAAAIRLDFPVLWSALLWLARESDMEVLSAHVDRLWGVVDDYATRARVAYLAERAILARQAADEQHSLLAGLFATNGEQTALVAQTATALQFDADEELWVVAAGAAHLGALAAAIDELPNDGNGNGDGGNGVRGRARGGSFTRFDGDGVLYVFGVESPSGRGVLDALSVACGLNRHVAGLAELPARAREAAVIDGLIPDGDHTPRTIQELWPRQVARTLGAAFPAFLAESTAGIDLLPEDERRRITDTVRVFLTTGSVQDTAERTFCHRNTVKNRLGQFTRLTGLDLRVPVEAAAAVIALEVLPLREHRHVTCL